MFLFNKVDHEVQTVLTDFAHGNIDAGQGGNGVIVELSHVDPNGEDLYVLGNRDSQFMAGIEHAVGQDVGFTEHGPGHPLFFMELLRSFYGAR